ncbi:MAG: CHAD domain-containing protein [Bacteroidota bacterium]
MTKSGFLRSFKEKSVEIQPFTIKKIASFILTKIEKRIKKRGAKLKTLHDIERNELRIDIKKLRYLTDLFMPVYDKKHVKEYIKHVVEIQDYLGMRNDIVNAEILLLKISNNLSQSVQFTAGKIIGWHTYASSCSSKKLLKKWRKFNSASQYWL